MSERQTPPDATRRSYVRGEHECCCGDPDCTEFEDRMAAWGIPLDEIQVVEFRAPLRERGEP